MKRNIEYMPDEYKNEPYFNKAHQTYFRRWSKKEEEWFKYLLSKGYTRKEIAESMGRTVQSIIDKKKKLSKNERTYNKKHSEEKKEINKLFLNQIKPVTILDVYCGENTLYDEYDTLKNDIDININADFHMDSLKLLCKLYSENKKFDLIDLDPYGSAYDCFDLAIKMAKKGLCVTLGEINLRRFGEIDYISYRYGINELSQVNSGNLIKHIQQIGLRNHKILEVYSKKDWGHISRVWFKIIPMEKRGKEWYQKKKTVCENKENLSRWIGEK